MQSKELSSSYMLCVYLFFHHDDENQSRRITAVKIPELCFAYIYSSTMNYNHL